MQLMNNPYQPPLEPNSTIYPSKEHLYTFQNLGPLTAIVTVLLLFGIIGSVAETLSSYGQLDMLNRARSGVEVKLDDISAIEARMVSMGLGAVAIYIVTAICFAIWIVRAHKNLRALKIQRLSYTPGWALGWFFVPFLNLIRPFQAMKDLWQASHAGAEWSTASSAKLVDFWWCLWLINNVYGAIISRTFSSQNSIDEVILATKIGMAGFLIHIPVCILAIKLVRGIHSAQEDLGSQSTLTE